MDKFPFSTQGNWQSDAQTGRWLGDSTGQPCFEPRNSASDRRSSYHQIHGNPPPPPHSVPSQSRQLSNPYSHSQQTSYHSPQHTHQHSLHTQQYSQAQYPQFEHPRTPPPSVQSAPINADFAPQVLANTNTHSRHKSFAPANRFAPYDKTLQLRRTDKMADPANVLAYPQEQMPELHAGDPGWRNAEMEELPFAPKNNPDGDDHGAAALPVASQLANLALVQRNVPRVGPPPVRNANDQPAQPREQPREVVALNMDPDSDSDSGLPAAADLVPKEKEKANRSTKNPARKNGDRAATPATASNVWTVDQIDLLIRYIVESDDNFKHAQKKGKDMGFWRKVEEVVFEGKRTAEAIQARWIEVKKTYQQIKAIKEVTGGGGDGDLEVNDDDTKASAKDRLRRHLEFVRENKPNIDPQGKVKNTEVYYNWVRGQDESWYNMMHCRFKDSTSIGRKRIRRSGDLLSTDLDSNSNGETSNETSSGQSTKFKGGKAAKSSKDGFGLAASAAKDFFANQVTIAEGKNTITHERLEIEKDRSRTADQMAVETLKMRCDIQKRKWAVEDREAAERAEETKRRRVVEDRNAGQDKILAQVQALNKLVTKTADEALKEIYRMRIAAALEGLSNV
ncbi:hypothetical protein FRC07_007136 [Ceratobasidium sp. 392]|nr:hypothetical protein FRC07_007136 [Ceratobasidium sp. 392]